jgi:hypothetical protein
VAKYRFLIIFLSIFVIIAIFILKSPEITTMFFNREITDGTKERKLNHLLLKIDLPRDTFSSGENIPIELFLKNEGVEAVKLFYRTAQKFEVVVQSRRGSEIWRWSADKFFTQMLEEVILQPGEEMSFSVSWNQVDNQGERISSGRYRIIGWSMAKQLREESVSAWIKIR